MSARHPMQPLLVDGEGVLRFKENRIVRHLLDAGPLDLNALAALDFDPEDWRQFAQLIGYSLDGWASLPYVDDASRLAARYVHERGLTEEQARLQVAEETLAALREALAEPVAALFGVHPDDLRKDL